MIGQLLASIAPGFRDARAPFVSGVLWALFGWLLWSDSIEPSDSAVGFQRQVYDLVDAAGTTITVLVVGTLVFVVGAISVEITQALSSALVASTSGLRPRLIWNRKALRKVRELRSQIDHWERMLRRLERRGAAASDQAKMQDQISKLHEQVASLDAQRVPMLRFWIRRNDETLELVPSRDPSPSFDAARALLLGAAERGAASALDKADSPPALNSPTYGGLVDEDDLQAEVEADPKAVISRADPASFVRLDRELAERSLRIAIGPPVVAVATLLALREQSWVIGGVALAAFLLFVGLALWSERRLDLIAYSVLAITQYETNSLTRARLHGVETMRRQLAESHRSDADPSKPSVQSK